MAFLIDTDRVIDALAGRADALAMLRRLPPRRVGVSVVTYGETLEVAFNSPNPAARIGVLRTFFGTVDLLPVTEAIMGRFAEIRAHLRRRGELIGDFDLIIGATALEHDLTIVTRNLRHFGRIPDLKLFPSRG